MVMPTNLKPFGRTPSFLYWVRVQITLDYRITDIEYVAEGPSAEWVLATAISANLNAEFVVISPITADRQDFINYNVGEGAEDMGW